jgi:hypothetical protein
MLRVVDDVYSAADWIIDGKVGGVGRRISSSTDG